MPRIGSGGWFRFIPTHVGNTGEIVLNIGTNAVHPHACGEHLYRVQFSSNIAGSSPRMWGTRNTDLKLHLSSWFIPTHVGNTTRDSGSRILLSVHPHACGEHFDGADSGGEERGSSPRMWGTLSSETSPGPWIRFIPTHVGNTHIGTNKVIKGTVHPHACGEHHAQRHGERAVHGSSPRMWGTP